MRIETKKLGFEADGKTIIENIDIEVENHEFIGVIGPNGSGKSTLLKNIYKILKPDHGAVYVNGVNENEISSKKLAQQLAVVSQENSMNFDFTVTEIVLMGAYPRKKLFESTDSNDKEQARQFLKKVGLEDFAERSFLNLSGGEKQRVIIARALMQKTDILILDEPTNHLDIGAQIKTLDIIKNMEDKTTVTALHDLNIAAKYCDRIYVMKDGHIIKEGKPAKVITPTLIKELYDIDAYVQTDNDRINIIYI